MRKLEHFLGIGKGDVVVVTQPFTLKGTIKKEVTWRWFGVVSETLYKSNKIRVIRVGQPADERLLSLFDLNAAGREIHFLEPEEWPDGVHVFRTRMILKGEIDLD
jgi:hypothetical protein